MVRLQSILITLALSGCVSLASAQDSTVRSGGRPVTTANPKTPVASKSNTGKPVANTPPAKNAYGQPAGTMQPRASSYSTRQVAPTPYGQTPTQAAPVNNDKSLNGQYQYLTTKFYNYQRPQLSAFYKNITDTLRTLRQQLKTANGKLSEQGKTVQGLQADATAKEQILNEATSKKDAISLLGIEMSKSSYNLLMWGLVILFGAVAAVVVVQSGSARREAKYRTKLYDDLDEDYKTYKVKANEKEKKLARELQTARNKLEDLTGNPGY